MDKNINDLEKSIHHLKSKLVHDQLRKGSYSFKNLVGLMDEVLGVYEKEKSLAMAAYACNVDVKMVMGWYVNGQMGIPEFKYFSEAVKKINNNSIDDVPHDSSEKNYVIYESENCWIYACEIDGEKFSVIANDLERLKQKVRNKNLPLDWNRFKISVF